MDALNQVGALGTLVMSLLGLLLPKAAARFVGLQPLTPAGPASGLQRAKVKPPFTG